MRREALYDNIITHILSFGTGWCSLATCCSLLLQLISDHLQDVENLIEGMLLFLFELYEPFLLCHLISHHHHLALAYQSLIVTQTHFVFRTMILCSFISILVFNV